MDITIPITTTALYVIAVGVSAAFALAVAYLFPQKNPFWEMVLGLYPLVIVGSLIFRSDFPKSEPTDYTAVLVAGLVYWAMTWVFRQILSRTNPKAFANSKT